MFGESRCALLRPISAFSNADVLRFVRHFLPALRSHTRPTVMVVFVLVLSSSGFFDSSGLPLPRCFALFAIAGEGGCAFVKGTTTGASLHLNRHELMQVMQHLASELYTHQGYSAALRSLQGHPQAQRLIAEAASASRAC